MRERMIAIADRLSKRATEEHKKWEGHVAGNRLHTAAKCAMRSEILNIVANEIRQELK